MAGNGRMCGVALFFNRLIYIPVSTWGLTMFHYALIAKHNRTSGKQVPKVVQISHEELLSPVMIASRLNEWNLSLQSQESLNVKRAF